MWPERKQKLAASRSGLCFQKRKTLGEGKGLTEEGEGGMGFVGTERTSILGKTEGQLGQRMRPGQEGEGWARGPRSVLPCFPAAFWGGGQSPERNGYA